MASATKPPAVIDITRVINEERFSRFQVVVLATCFLLMMLDTIDATLMAFIAPAIAGGWLVALCGLIGITVTGIDLPRHPEHLTLPVLPAT